MTERDEALKLANKVLDRPHADPDDDLAMLARTLLREIDTTYLVWSNEHCGWLMPGPTKYSPRVTEAGGYSRIAAMAICANLVTGDMRSGAAIVAAIPIRADDVREFIKGRT